MNPATANKKPLTPDVGYGYRGMYVDKKTGDEVQYLKLYIRPEELAKLPVGANGVIALTGFITQDKKSEKTPDLVIKPSLAKSGASNARSNTAVKTASPAAARASSSFPF